MSDIKINKAIADAYASMYAPKQEEAPVVQEEAPEVHEEPSDLEEGKKLDPVGKEDGDIDNDGDKDEADKYLARRRKTIAKILKKKKDVKEKTECPKCEGEGCDHCDGKGYHESKNVTEARVGSYAERNVKKVARKVQSEMKRRNYKKVADILTDVWVDSEDSEDMDEFLDWVSDTIIGLGFDDYDTLDVVQYAEEMFDAHLSVTQEACGSKKKMNEVEEPRAKGEKDFKDKHTVKVSADLEEKKYKAPTQAEIDADKKKDKKGKARPSMSAKSASKSVYKNMMGGLKD